MSRFPFKNFLSHNTETFRRGTLLYCVSEKFRQRKSLWIRRGEYHDFPSEFFCLTVPKNFVGDPFGVSLIWGIENFYASEGYVTIFRRKFFVSVPKHFVKGPFCADFQRNYGSEKVSGSEGGSITIFCQTFFVSQCRKNS